MTKIRKKLNELNAKNANKWQIQPLHFHASCLGHWPTQHAQFYFCGKILGAKNRKYLETQQKLMRDMCGH